MQHFIHVIQKQSDRNWNVSLFARQLCYYEDWISISYCPVYVQVVPT